MAQGHRLSAVSWSRWEKGRTANHNQVWYKDGTTRLQQFGWPKFKARKRRHMYDSNILTQTFQVKIIIFRHQAMGTTEEIFCFSKNQFSHSCAFCHHYQCQLSYHVIFIHNWHIQSGRLDVKLFTCPKFMLWPSHKSQKVWDAWNRWTQIFSLLCNKPPKVCIMCPQFDWFCPIGVYCSLCLCPWPGPVSVERRGLTGEGADIM